MMETIAEVPASEAVTAPVVAPEVNVPEAAQTQEAKRDPITNLHSLLLFHQPPGTLRLTVQRDTGDGFGAYSYTTVKLFQAVPLSMPGRYIVLQDSKGEEIAMADKIDDFAPEARIVAEDELRRRYLTAKITAVPNIRQDFGITYWDVLTDRGKRDFVVQSMSESCVWLSETHILIADVDGNRFEIPDRMALDPHSQEQLAQVM